MTGHISVIESLLIGGGDFRQRNLLSKFRLRGDLVVEEASDILLLLCL
jgi:hypothetical protein